MNISDMFRVWDAFQAEHGWRFRFVEQRWWVWEEDHWRSWDARPRIVKTIHFIAESVLDDPRLRAQVGREYLMKRLVAGLIPYLRSDQLPGNPATASRRPSEPPAP